MKAYTSKPNCSTLSLTDDEIPYPRICAHRGFNTVAPENSMPAFAQAIALGAQEIEFDLWSTKDGELIVCHDDNLDRVADISGRLCDLTYEEILKADIGIAVNEKYKGLRLPLFEHVLKKFACHTVMNIHVKSPSPEKSYDEKVFQKIVDLIYQYGCEKHVYIAGLSDVMETAIKLAPELTRCMLSGGENLTIVERALKYGCKKLQFFKPTLNQKMIDEAHSHKIRCNIFWSDDGAEAKGFLNMGIDTILTNDYFPVKNYLGI